MARDLDGAGAGTGAVAAAATRPRREGRMVIVSLKGGAEANPA